MNIFKLLLPFLALLSLGDCFPNILQAIEDKWNDHPIECSLAGVLGVGVPVGYTFMHHKPASSPPRDTFTEALLPTCNALDSPFLRPDLFIESTLIEPHGEYYNVCAPSDSPSWEEHTKSLEINGHCTTLIFTKWASTVYGALQGNYYKHQWKCIAMSLLLPLGFVVWYYWNQLREAASSACRANYPRRAFWRSFEYAAAAWHLLGRGSGALWRGGCFVCGGIGSVLGICGTFFREASYSLGRWAKSTAIASWPYICDGYSLFQRWRSHRVESLCNDTIAFSQWLADMWRPHWNNYQEGRAQTAILPEDVKAELDKVRAQTKQNTSELSRVSVVADGAWNTAQAVRNGPTDNYYAIHDRVAKLERKDDGVRDDARKMIIIGKQAFEDLSKAKQRYKKRSNEEYRDLAESIARTDFAERLSQVEGAVKGVKAEFENQPKQAQPPAPQPDENAKTLKALQEKNKDLEGQMQALTSKVAADVAAAVEEAVRPLQNEIQGLKKQLESKASGAELKELDTLVAEVKTGNNKAVGCLIENGYGKDAASNPKDVNEPTTTTTSMNNQVVVVQGLANDVAAAHYRVDIVNNQAMWLTAAVKAIAKNTDLDLSTVSLSLEAAEDTTAQGHPQQGPVPNLPSRAVEDASAQETSQPTLGTNPPIQPTKPLHSGKEQEPHAVLATADATSTQGGPAPALPKTLRPETLVKSSGNEPETQDSVAESKPLTSSSQKPPISIKLKLNPTAQFVPRQVTNSSRRKANQRGNSRKPARTPPVSQPPLPQLSASESTSPDDGPAMGIEAAQVQQSLSAVSTTEDRSVQNAVTTSASQSSILQPAGGREVHRNDLWSWKLFTDCFPDGEAEIIRTSSDNKKCGFWAFIASMEEQHDGQEVEFLDMQSAFMCHEVYGYYCQELGIENVDDFSGDQIAATARNWARHHLPDADVYVGYVASQVPGAIAVFGPDDVSEPVPEGRKRFIVWIHNDNHKDILQSRGASHEEIENAYNHWSGLAKPGVSPSTAYRTKITVPAPGTLSPSSQRSVRFDLPPSQESSTDSSASMASKPYHSLVKSHQSSEALPASENTSQSDGHHLADKKLLDEERPSDEVEQQQLLPEQESIIEGQQLDLEPRQIGKDERDKHFEAEIRDAQRREQKRLLKAEAKRREAQEETQRLSDEQHQRDQEQAWLDAKNQAKRNAEEEIRMTEENMRRQASKVEDQVVVDQEMSTAPPVSVEELQEVQPQFSPLVFSSVDDEEMSTAPLLVLEQAQDIQQELPQQAPPEQPSAQNFKKNSIFSLPTAATAALGNDTVRQPWNWSATTAPSIPTNASEQQQKQHQPSPDASQPTFSPPMGCATTAPADSRLTENKSKEEFERSFPQPPSIMKNTDQDDQSKKGLRAIIDSLTQQYPELTKPAMSDLLAIAKRQVRPDSIAMYALDLSEIIQDWANSRGVVGNKTISLGVRTAIDRDYTYAVWVPHGSQKPDCIVWIDDNNLGGEAQEWFGLGQRAVSEPRRTKTQQQLFFSAPPSNDIDAPMSAPNHFAPPQALAFDFTSGENPFQFSKPSDIAEEQLPNDVDLASEKPSQKSQEQLNALQNDPPQAKGYFDKHFPNGVETVSTDGEDGVLERVFHALVSSLKYQHPNFNRPSIAELMIVTGTRSQKKFENGTLNFDCRRLDIVWKRYACQVCDHERVWLGIQDAESGLYKIFTDPQSRVSKDPKAPIVFDKFRPKDKVVWIRVSSSKSTHDCLGLRPTHPEIPELFQRRGEKFFRRDFPNGAESIPIGSGQRENAFDALSKSLSEQYGHKYTKVVPKVPELEAIHEALGGSFDQVVCEDDLALVLMIWMRLYRPADRTIYFGWVADGTSEPWVHLPKGVQNPREVVFVGVIPTQRYTALRPRTNVPRNERNLAPLKRNELGQGPTPPKSSKGFPTPFTLPRSSLQSVNQESNSEFTKADAGAAFTAMNDHEQPEAGQKRSRNTARQESLSKAKEQGTPAAAKRILKPKSPPLASPEPDMTVPPSPDLTKLDPFLPEIYGREKLFGEGKTTPTSPVQSSTESEASEDEGRGMRTADWSLLQSNTGFQFGSGPNQPTQPAVAASSTRETSSFQSQRPTSLFTTHPWPSSPSNASSVSSGSKDDAQLFQEAWEEDSSSDMNAEMGNSGLQVTQSTNSAPEQFITNAIGTSNHPSEEQPQEETELDDFEMEVEQFQA